MFRSAIVALAFAAFASPTHVTHDVTLRCATRITEDGAAHPKLVRFERDGGHVSITYRCGTP